MSACASNKENFCNMLSAVSALFSLCDELQSPEFYFKRLM